MVFKIESFIYLGYCFEFELTVNRTAEPSFRHITGLVILLSDGVVVDACSSLSILIFFAVELEMGSPEAKRMFWFGL